MKSTVEGQLTSVKVYLSLVNTWHMRLWSVLLLSGIYSEIRVLGIGVQLLAICRSLNP